MAENRYIVVEGVIGAGKTSLSRLLSERLQAKLVLEEVEENPFLKDFYQDRERFAFQTQMHFLFSRYQQQRSLRQMDLFHERMVADYLFQKDRIFASFNCRMYSRSMSRSNGRPRRPMRIMSVSGLACK